MIDEGWCQIGNKGCFHLGKLEAKEIKILSLSWESGEIGEQGAFKRELTFAPAARPP